MEQATHDCLGCFGYFWGRVIGMVVGRVLMLGLGLAFWLYTGWPRMPVIRSLPYIWRGNLPPAMEWRVFGDCMTTRVGASPHPVAAKKPRASAKTEGFGFRSQPADSAPPANQQWASVFAVCWLYRWLYLVCEAVAFNPPKHCRF